MVQIVLIGIAAGAATALLFASVASGVLLSVLLFYLAPLPIMIAAIGWSHLAGLIAALAASAALAFVFDSYFFLAFLFGVGLPAWWLGYLALLGRPNAADPSLIEWYPVGHLVLWTAILGALVVTATIPNFGLDAETFRNELRRTFERIIRVQAHIPAEARLELPGLTDPTRLLDFLVMAIPPAAAVLSTLTNVVNLWLAGRIVHISGRLKRPWPELSSMRFPQHAPALLAAAVAATFLPGLVSVVATLFTASLLVVYAMLGFAVLHVVTRALSGRGFVLGGVYAAVAVFGWPILIMIALGLADSLFDIRGRFIAKRGPPAPRE